MVAVHPPSNFKSQHIKDATIIEFQAASGEAAELVQSQLLPNLARRSESEDPSATPMYGLKQIPFEIGGQHTDDFAGENAWKYCVIDFSTMDPDVGEKGDLLKENNDLIAGGFADGFANRVQNYNIIGIPHVGNNVKTSRYLLYTPITAGEGHDVTLMQVLQMSQEAVYQSEIKTSFSAVLQRRDDVHQFAVIEMFDSIEGIHEHYVNPSVMMKLVEEATERNSDLIVDGLGGAVTHLRMYEFVDLSRVDAFPGSGVTEEDVAAWKAEREAAGEIDPEKLAELEAQRKKEEEEAAAAERERLAAEEEAAKEARRKQFLEEAALKSKNEDKGASAVTIQKTVRGYLTRVRVFRTVLENERARWESMIEAQVVAERKRATLLEKDRQHVEWYWANYLNEIDQLKRLKEAEIKRHVQSVNQKTRIMTRELMRKENKRRDETLMDEAVRRMELRHEFEFFSHDIRTLEEKRITSGLTVQGTRKDLRDRSPGFLNSTRGFSPSKSKRKSAYDHIELPDEPSHFVERSREIQSHVHDVRTGKATAKYKRTARAEPMNLNKVRFAARNDDHDASLSTNKLDRTQLFELARSRYGNEVE